MSVPIETNGTMSKIHFMVLEERKEANTAQSWFAGSDL